MTELNEKTIENFLLFNNPDEKTLYFIQGEIKGNQKT